MHKPQTLPANINIYSVGMHSVLARMNNLHWQQIIPNLWAMIVNFLYGVSVFLIIQEPMSTK